LLKVEATLEKEGSALAPQPLPGPTEELEQIFEQEELYYSREEVQTYIDLLSKYLENSCKSDFVKEKVKEKLEKVKLCNTKKFIYTCEKEGSNHHVKVVFNHCNERKLCPNCSKRYAKRRAIEIYEFLKQNLVHAVNFKVYLTHVVITFPHDLELAQLEAIEKKMGKILKRVFISIRKNRETTILYRIHRYSSKNPFKKHLHVHVICPNVALVKNHDEFRYVRLTPYFNIEKLKSRIIEAIYIETGLIIPPPVVYSRFHAIKNEGSVLHALTYIFRTPAIDFFKFFKAFDGNRMLLESVYLDWYDTLFFRITNETRPTWLGFLANARRYRLPIPLPHRLEEVKKRLKEEAFRCRICGAKLVKFESLEPAVDDLLFHYPEALLWELRRLEAIRKKMRKCENAEMRKC